MLLGTNTNEFTNVAQQVLAEIFEPIIKTLLSAAGREMQLFCPPRIPEYCPTILLFFPPPIMLPTPVIQLRHPPATIAS